MSSLRDGVGFEGAVETGGLARGPEQRQQRLGQRRQEDQSVTAIRSLEANLREAEPEPRVLRVAEGFLDGESLPVEGHDLRRSEVRAIRRQAPRVLHACSLHGDEAGDGMLVGREGDALEQSCSAARRNEVGSGKPLAVGGGDEDRLAKADHEVPSFACEELVELGIAEASIGDDRDPNVIGDRCVQPQQQLVLEVVSRPVLDVADGDGLPQERRRAAMRGHDVRGDDRVAVARILGPVQGDDHVLALAEDEVDPRQVELLELQVAIGEEPVDLLDRVLGVESLGGREPGADQREGERARFEHSDHAVGHGGLELRVELIIEGAGHHRRHCTRWDPSRYRPVPRPRGSSSFAIPAAG